MDPENLMSPPDTNQPTVDPSHQQASTASSSSPLLSPEDMKMEPAYSQQKTEAAGLGRCTNYFACQAGPRYDMASDSQASFEHYALHNSPTGTVFPSQTCSNHSSPRSSWASPDQFRSLAWNQTTQSQQYGQFGTDVDYLHNSPAPVPSATSYPAIAMYTPSPNFDGPEPSYQVQDSRLSVYQTAPYPMSPVDGLPACSDLGRSLSACSSPLGNLRADVDLPSPTPASEADEDLMGTSQYPKVPSPKHHCHSPPSSTVGSPTINGAGNVSSNKGDEPYAQLIYRAFMSTPRRAMTLQDLYQWFRENTKKAMQDGKGWQNSIRHNLSMNKAFTKRERRHSGAFSTDDIDGSGRICLSSDAGVSDNKNAKSSEWYLEPEFELKGVESTTRYRTKNARHQNRHGSSAYGRSRDSHSRLGCHPEPTGPSKKGSHHSHGQAGSGYGTSRLRGNSRHQSHSSTTSNPMHGLPHHYHPDPTVAAAHHHFAHHQHTLPPMIGDPAAYATYYDYPAQSALYGPEYAYPNGHTHSSESGVDEPMTPEPSYSSDLLIPDLHRAGVPSSSNASYDADAGYAYPHPAAAAAVGAGVGVYDEMVDRYSGWTEEPTTVYHPQY